MFVIVVKCTEWLEVMHVWFAVHFGLRYATAAAGIAITFKTSLSLTLPVGAIVFLVATFPTGTILATVVRRRFAWKVVFVFEPMECTVADRE